MTATGTMAVDGTGRAERMAGVTAMVTGGVEGVAGSLAGVTAMAVGGVDRVMVVGVVL